MTSIKGKGEVACKFILQTLFTNAIVMEQVTLPSLIASDLKKDLSDRELKETIDLVIYPYGDSPIAVRIQGEEHSTYNRSNKDKIQKRMLEMSGVRVIDIWYYDAPALWRDVVNKDSIKEVKKAMKDYL